MAASQRAIRAGRAIVEFGLTDKDVAKSLKRLERRFSMIGRSLQRMGTIAAAAGGAIIGAFAAAVKVFAQTGDQLNKMSARTGIGAQALSELGFAAERRISLAVAKRRARKTTSGVLPKSGWQMRKSACGRRSIRLMPSPATLPVV